MRRIKINHQKEMISSMNHSKSDSVLDRRVHDNVDRDLRCNKKLNKLNILKNINVDEITKTLFHKMSDNEKNSFKVGLEFLRKRLSIELSDE